MTSFLKRIWPPAVPSVFYAYKKQAAGWSCGSRCRAVPNGQDAPQVTAVEEAFADHQERPGQVPRHVMKKAAAAHGIDQFLAFSLPFGRVNGAHIAYFHLFFSSFRVYGCERREVMFADNNLGRGDHRLLIQRVRMVMDVSRQPRRADFTPIDSGTIGLGPRRPAPRGI